MLQHEVISDILEISDFVVAILKNGDGLLFQRTSMIESRLVRTMNDEGHVDICTDKSSVRNASIFHKARL